MKQSENNNLTIHSKQSQSNFNALQQIEIANTVYNELEKSAILDKFKNNKTGEIDKGKVISTIIKGAKIGLDPFTSIEVSENLKNTSVFAIDLGLSLGLTGLEAIQKIHSISNKNGGHSLHTSVHVISKKLIEAGVKIEIIKDYAPVYSYLIKTSSSKDFIPIESDIIEDENGRVKDKFFIIDVSTTQKEVDDAKNENKVFIKRYLSDYVTTIRMSRKSTDTVIELSYYRSDAIKAGLLKSVDSKGNVINEGKFNWNTNEKGMMRNRLISNIGRIIAADRLNGVYDIESEIEHIANDEQISQID